MTRNQAFPSKYLSKEDVATAVLATIAGTAQEELEGDQGKKLKAILYFEEAEMKPWVIPNCSWMEIEALYGPDSDSWIGHQIEVYADPSVMFGNKRVGGVRCRRPAGQAPRQPAPAARTFQKKTP